MFGTATLEAILPPTTLPAMKVMEVKAPGLQGQGSKSAIEPRHQEARSCWNSETRINGKTLPKPVMLAPDQIQQVAADAATMLADLRLSNVAIPIWRGGQISPVMFQSGA